MSLKDSLSELAKKLSQVHITTPTTLPASESGLETEKTIVDTASTIDDIVKKVQESWHAAENLIQLPNFNPKNPDNQTSSQPVVKTQESKKTYIYIFIGAVIVGILIFKRKKS
jgi:hypothetical protein